MLLAALTVTVLLVGVAPAWACPTCKDSLANDPHQQNMVAGYFYSILFMMAMPFLIIGSFGSYVLLTCRRARRNAAIGDADESREPATSSSAK